MLENIKLESFATSIKNGKNGRWREKICINGDEKEFEGKTMKTIFKKSQAKVEQKLSE